MKDIKILIMVLSYMEPPYDELYRSQIETWDSVPEENVHTLFYHGGSRGVKADTIRQHHKSTSTLLRTNETDSYYYMAGKFRTALLYAMLAEPTIIFRTNSSSYINKKRLKQFAATLPTEKLYAGWTFVDSEDFGGLCVSGAGIFLSRDTAEILRNEIDPKFEMEEDVYCGRILRKHGIEAIDDKSRVDIPEYVPAYFDTNAYHYRCKFGGDRTKDANNMRWIHQKIIK